MSVPDDLPYPTSSLSTLSTTLGPVATGVFVHKNKSQIIGTDEEIYNSTFVHDDDLNDTQEIARETVTMEEDAESAEMTLGTLHTNPSVLKSIQPVICTSALKTNINTISGDGLTSCKFTLDSTGLSWDSNDTSLYFSSSKTFRIRFIEKDGSTPSKLLIEGYSGSEYIIKHEITST